MKLLGFSLDNLSLMALTISTGFVVDDAIVMIENIVRYIEAGEELPVAALKGCLSKLVSPIYFPEHLAGGRVHSPALLRGGIVGRLFREFAITLSVAVGVSGGGFH